MNTMGYKKIKFWEKFRLNHESILTPWFFLYTSLDERRINNDSKWTQMTIGILPRWELIQEGDVIQYRWFKQWIFKEKSFMEFYNSCLEK